jgi:putative endonuclease
VAERYLVDRGYTVLERNAVVRPGELDLVMRAPEDAAVVFVEVKTRGPRALVDPLASITPAKRRLLVQAAAGWLARHDPGDVPVRFDVVAVRTGRGVEPVLEHLPGAFDASDLDS